MTATALVLLGIGVAGALARPWGLPPWATPVTCAALTVLVGAIQLPVAADALQPLVEPLAFLLLAVPLATLLDGLGVFDAAARLVTGRHMSAGLWALAAVTVAVLNLDAAVVLLTPLYVRVARRWGLDPVAVAFQPALLACLASSALPVSNLTNLIAIEARPLPVGAFLRALGLPTLVACVVGYGMWRLAFRARPLVPIAPVADGAVERRPVLIGATVVGALVAGFVPGRSLGLEPWMVVAAVDVVLVLSTRSLPVRSVPVGTAALAVALGVLAAAVASRVTIGEVVVDEGDLAATASVVALGALGANALNNLPALLLGLDSVANEQALWALLLGVNVGPVVVVTGSLSGLLWLDAVRREGLDVTAFAYARVGAVVGLPSLVAATLVLGW